MEVNGSKSHHGLELLGGLATEGPLLGALPDLVLPLVRQGLLVIVVLLVLELERFLRCSIRASLITTLAGVSGLLSSSQPRNATSRAKWTRRSWSEASLSSSPSTARMRHSKR